MAADLSSAGKRRSRIRLALLCALLVGAFVLYRNRPAHYLNTERRALADEAFCRELETAPGDGRAHHYRGLALQARHQDAAAARQFQQAIALAPDFPDSYLSLALNWTRHQQEEKI